MTPDNPVDSEQTAEPDDPSSVVPRAATTFITIYAYGGIAGPCLTSHLGLVTDIANNKRDANVLIIAEEALISRSRCRATRLFLDSGRDVWLQIDHDIGFRAEDAFALCALALRHGAAICIPYSCRSLPPRAAVRAHAGLPIPPVGTDALTPISMFAAGFLALPRACVLRTLEVCKSPNVSPEFRVVDCVDDLVNTYPTLWKPLVLERAVGVWEYLSEDYSAAARMRLAGIPQFAWTNPKLEHYGTFPFSLPTS